VKRRLREAYAEFLMGHPWDLFLTLTFDRKKYAPMFIQSHEKADKDFRRLIQYVNECLYGKRWLRDSKHKGVIWARVQEPHVDGSLHFHACLHSPSAPIPAALIRAIRDWWGSRYGMARSEMPRCQGDVVRYLVKHIADPERAELDISRNF
jgi:hypothetical protein